MEWSYNDDKWKVDFSELIYPNTKYIQKKKQKNNTKTDLLSPSHPIHTHCTLHLHAGQENVTAFRISHINLLLWDMSWLTGKGRRVRRGTKELDKIPSSCCSPQLFFLFGEVKSADFQVSAVRLRLRPRSTAQTVGWRKKEKDNSEAKRNLLTYLIHVFFFSGFRFLADIPGLWLTSAQLSERLHFLLCRDSASFIQMKGSQQWSASSDARGLTRINTEASLLTHKGHISLHH